MRPSLWSVHEKLDKQKKHSSTSKKLNFWWNKTDFCPFCGHSLPFSGLQIWQLCHMCPLGEKKPTCWKSVTEVFGHVSVSGETNFYPKAIVPRTRVAAWRIIFLYVGSQQGTFYHKAVMGKPPCGAKLSSCIAYFIGKEAQDITELHRCQNFLVFTK